MAGVPITNSFGEVNYGAAVPVETADYTKDLLAGMREKQAEEAKALEEQRQLRRQAKERQNKYSADLNRLVMTQGKNILPIHSKEYLAHAAELIDLMKEGSKNSSDYNPYNDDKFQGKEAEFENQIDMWQQEKKKNDESAVIALDQKKQGNYEINHDALKAAYGTDPDAYYKALAKYETKTDLFPIYGGVGILKPKDTTDIYNSILKDAKSLAPDQIQSVVGDLTHRTKEFSQAEKEQIADRFYMSTKGQQLAQNFMNQQEAHGFYPDPAKAQQYVRENFISSIPGLNEWKKAGGTGKSLEEKETEKFGSSPYSSKGDGNHNGITFFSKDKNTGLKTDLSEDNSATQGLRDVDFKTAYLDNGNLKAIVQERVTEDRPMTEAEKKPAMEKYKAELEDWKILSEKNPNLPKPPLPNFTKSVTVEKPRTIDLAVGSNNYNTIVNQYPFVKTKLDELAQSSGQNKSKSEPAKKSGPQKGDKKQFKEGSATFNGTKWVLDK